MQLPMNSFCNALATESPLNELWGSLVDLFVALWGIAYSLVQLVTPWTPLLAWVAFWLFAVNWVKLRQVLLQGAWTGVVLTGLVMVIVWGSISPGNHELFGLHVSNFVGKTVYVTMLFCIMFLCGSVQLAGFLPNCCRFAEVGPAEDDHHATTH